jgi:PAS domain S-box-containing protein
VETSQDLIWQCDAEGRYTYLNPAWESTFGYKTEEMLGKKFSDFQTPEMAERDSNEFRRLMRGNMVKGLETVHLGKNGNKIHLVFNAKFVQDEHGTIIGTRGTAHNITERKQAEELVLQSEENYHFQFLHTNSYNSLYEVIVGNDGKPCDFRFIMVNPAYEEYVGRKASELIGKTLLEVYPNTEQYWIDKMAEAVLTGLPIHFDNFSQVMNTHTEINLYIPKKGQLAMTTANINERKRAEEALRQSESRLRVINENIADTIIMTDSNGRITYINKVAAGMTMEQVLCATVYDFVPPEQKFVVEKALSDAFEHGLNSKYVSLGPGPEGTYRNYEVNVSPVFGTDKVTAAVFLARDISERMRLEEALHTTQKLESLGILAGGIAHDFNNLMGGIFGYIDNALEKTRDEHVIRDLTKAMTTIDRARALTQQLLTFAKGGAPIQKVGKLFPFIEETAQFALSGSTVNCTCESPRDLWPCNFDKNQIGQVIDNIIINAQQAMAMGGTIHLNARNIILSEIEHPSLPAGNYVKISIKDTGIGIPKEQISRIFDPFFTTKTKGHGLGLATCYSIINRHGGFIDVESELGRGSTFHVYLPACIGTVASDENRSDTPHNGSGTFIIMDDEAVMRETIHDMFGSFGYTVVCTENGQDAIDLFIKERTEKRTVAGMIFDLTVPGAMGGKAAVTEIRKIDPDIPVFVVSGYAEDPVMKEPSKHGFTASICKPFRKAELSEMLNKYMHAKE